MSADAVTPDVPEIQHDHPDVTGGWLRPAVFGAMDGLVSNLALIAGVAGGTRDSADSSAVVLAGLAGLAAGAFSMAAGEYTSVASQSEAGIYLALVPRNNKPVSSPPVVTNDNLFATGLTPCGNDKSCSEQ